LFPNVRVAWFATVARAEALLQTGRRQLPAAGLIVVVGFFRIGS